MFRVEVLFFVEAFFSLETNLGQSVATDSLSALAEQRRNKYPSLGFAKNKSIKCYALVVNLNG